jgi:hypothetical protein
MQTSTQLDLSTFGHLILLRSSILRAYRTRGRIDSDVVALSVTEAMDTKLGVLKAKCMLDPVDRLVGWMWLGLFITNHYTCAQVRMYIRYLTKCAGVSVCLKLGIHET